MPDNDDSSTACDNSKDPVDSAELNRLVWVKLILALFVAAVAAVTVSVTSETRPLLVDPSQFADPLGVKAATFAICAAAMLSLTMINAGNGPDKRIVDFIVRLGSLAFAFMSGWSWLESALGEFSLPYYTMTIGSLALIVVVGLLFWPATSLIYRYVRNLLRHIWR